MSHLLAGRTKYDCEACESTKSKSCCTTSLNAVTRRAVATLRGGGNSSCRHILQVSTIWGMIFNAARGASAAARMECMRF
eukprot:12896821-Prorocentrum_lima.AAC.1